MDWFQSFFGWPDGGVWSNLLASAIWAFPALRWHHRAVKAHITSELERLHTAPKRQEVAAP